VSDAPSPDPAGLAAVIVGCGRIAGGFNEHSEAQVLTHALAYRRLGIPMAGCCDRDPARARAFAQRWGIARHGVRAEDVIGDAPVVVSVCTPPSAQPEILRALMAHPSVRAVLLEKPLGATLAAAEELSRQAEAWGRPVLVNYFRAFTAFYRDLEGQLRGPRWGAVRSVTAHYKGTLASHVSHALERLIASFGAPASVRRLAGDDDTPLFEATFREGVRALFVPLPDVSYSVFELDFFCAKGRLRVVDSERRAEFSLARPDADYAGYSVLEAVSPDTPGMTFEMTGAVEAAVEAARRGRDASGIRLRAVEVARALEGAAGPRARLSGS
jgi:predicted dehydrogenase